MNRYLEAMYLVPRGLRHLQNPATALRHVLGLARGETVQYRLKGGLVFSLSTAPRDRPSIMSLEEIFGQQVYPVPAEGDLCIIDAGAHVGLFSLFAAERNRRARIFAYEAA